MTAPIDHKEWAKRIIALVESGVRVNPANVIMARAALSMPAERAV